MPRLVVVPFLWQPATPPALPPEVALPCRWSASGAQPLALAIGLPNGQAGALLPAATQLWALAAAAPRAWTKATALAQLAARTPGFPLLRARLAGLAEPPEFTLAPALVVHAPDLGAALALLAVRAYAPLALPSGDGADAGA